MITNIEKYKVFLFEANDLKFEQFAERLNFVKDNNNKRTEQFEKLFNIYKNNHCNFNDIYKEKEKFKTIESEIKYNIVEIDLIKMLEYYISTYKPDNITLNELQYRAKFVILGGVDFMKNILFLIDISSDDRNKNKLINDKNVKTFASKLIIKVLKQAIENNKIIDNKIRNFDELNKYLSSIFNITDFLNNEEFIKKREDNDKTKITKQARITNLNALYSYLKTNYEEPFNNKTLDNKDIKYSDLPTDKTEGSGEGNIKQTINYLFKELNFNIKISDIITKENLKIVIDNILKLKTELNKK